MLAILYDIHGNLPALEAVLADARGAGADAFVLGGDYAAFGAWPAETVAELDRLPRATWIRGNWDRWAGEEARDMPKEPVVTGAREFVTGALGMETVGRLYLLPPTARLGSAFFCHASPRSDMEALAPEGTDRDEELLADVDAELVVFGHIHVQLRRQAADGETLVVNPGSVGLPFDGDQRAAYALLGADGTVDLRRVPYDAGASITALRDLATEWADATASRLERARF